MQTADRLKTRTLGSPVGDLVIHATDEALIAITIDSQKHATDFHAEKITGKHLVLDSAERDLKAYFAGKWEIRTPFAMSGTPFQIAVWNALTTIPFGETWSYGQLAKKIGNPNAVRAVGVASSRNRIGILVPCHRVIGADGSLTGYAGGIENKKWLLDHEAEHGERKSAAPKQLSFT